MKGPLSFAQELRSIRRRDSSKGSSQVPELGDTERPWQVDINQMQQTLQEVLQVVSQVSGVELQGVNATQNDGQSVTQLDRETLKHQIRKDLETFSATATADLTKQAEEQTLAALGAVQEEVRAQIDQAANEFREQLQGRLQAEQLQVDLAQQSRKRVSALIENQTDEFARWVWITCKGTGTPIPAQIEKLLEPYAEEALVKFTGSLQQRVQDLLAGQEQTVQGWLQRTATSLKNKIGSLEQASLQMCQRNADEVTKQSTERLSAMSEEAARNLQRRIEDEVETALGRFQTRLEETTASLQEGLHSHEEEHANSFSQKLQKLSAETEERHVAEVGGHIERIAADVIESSVQHLHQQAGDSLEHSKETLRSYLEFQTEEVRLQIGELGRSVHETLSQDSARLNESLQGLDQKLAEIENDHIAACEQQLSVLIQRTMELLAGRIQEVTEKQMEVTNRLLQNSQNEAASQYESQLQKSSESMYRDLLERVQNEAREAGLKAAEEVRSTSESLLKEITEKSNASASILREQAIQATTQAESSIKNSLDTYQQQLSQITSDGLEQQQHLIRKRVSDLQNRFLLAARLLEGEIPETIGGLTPNAVWTIQDVGGGSEVREMRIPNEEGAGKCPEREFE